MIRRSAKEIIHYHRSMCSCDNAHGLCPMFESIIAENLNLLRDQKNVWAESVVELEIQLSAWHSVFGSTQLTHASDRLDFAERKNQQLENQVERLNKTIRELESKDGTL